MSKLIAIIAPMLTDKQYEADFRILLKNNNQELNLKFFYEYIKNNYVIRDLKNRYSYKEDVIPAAGFFLSSKLRRSGYDTILTQFFDDSTLQDIARKNPLAVCISTTMILRKNACLQVIRQIKKNIPNIKIIIGGILTWKSYLVYIKGNKNDTVNINDEEWNLFKHFNDEFNNCLFITSPHGLSLLLCILKEIEKGKNADFFNIPNLVLPLKNSPYFTKYMEEIFDLNDEFTNWELLDKLPHRIPIRTSIGCSYRCTFCDFCTLYPKIIFRNINSIYKELITIKNVVESRHQPVILHFTDDNIFNTKQRLQDVCETIIKSQVESPWISFMRASSVNDSNIKLLKESNLLMTMMGIESGDPQILQAMNKKQDFLN